jgi:hypothetical protein
MLKLDRVPRRIFVSMYATQSFTLRGLFSSFLGIFFFIISFHFSPQVEADAREMSSDQFTKFMNDLNRQIMELVNSPQNEDKLSGIMVIGTLFFLFLINFLF